MTETDKPVFVATCVNAGCPEHGVPKPGDWELAEDTVVLCGGCNEPCEITDG